MAPEVITSKELISKLKIITARPRFFVRMFLFMVKFGLRLHGGSLNRTWCSLGQVFRALVSYHRKLKIAFDC